jgi:WNK lysine deficient protein kinase
MDEVKFSPNKRYVKFNKLIGTGSMKRVYQGYDLNEGKLIAWNTVEIDSLPKAFQAKIIQEIEILDSIKNKNKYIIDINNSWINKEKRTIYFITNFATGNDLSQFIKKVKYIKLKVIKKWCRQILSGLEFLHKNSIAHRDLKPSNIFINSNSGDIFIGDFGLAKVSNENNKSILGTPEYMAPEVYEESYDNRIDIYSFGMCLLEFMTGEIPYSECNLAAQIWKKITDRILPDCINKVNLPVAKDLILKCINQDPKERLNIDEILKHDFFLDTSNDDNIVNKNVSLNENEDTKSEEIINNFREKEEI